MTRFATMTLPEHPTVVAPDGSDVRVLLGLAGGGLAHFQLAAGATSRAVRHQTVEEISVCPRRSWRDVAFPGRP